MALPSRARGRTARRAGILVALGLLAAALWIVRAASPPPALSAGPRTVEIPPQRGVREVARLLEDGGVIRSRVVFVALAAIRGTARGLRAGEYEVPRNASLLQVLALVEQGRIKPRLVVVPEGATIRDVARLIAAEGLVPAAEVLRITTSPAFARAMGLDADGVEGYLFPDTYQVTKGMQGEEILGRMVQRFREKVATPDTLARARERGLSLHTLVTLASIVEKEAVLPAERPVIAGVFWNRLARDMPLQADPTVAYAVEKDGRPPTRQDLLVDHPFNTYRHRGLPPGPIGNPGLSSLEAVLAPAAVPYLYFVAIDGRQHHFSTTLAEHERAVTRYRSARVRS